MREIKFRAWSQHANRWIYYDGWLAHQNDRPNESEPFQFTGLKDKTGLQEVYEGDIIDVSGNKKGNIYENKQEETDLVIQGFGTADWEATNKEALARGCKYS